MSEAESSNPPSVKMRADRGGFVFEPTAAVAVSRTRSRFIDCPVCQADHSEYLFHRTGVRFVRCRNCAMVYVTPASDVRSNWFDIASIGQYPRPEDRALCVQDFDALVARFAAEYQRVEGRPLKKAALLGRFLPEFGETETARRVGLDVISIDEAGFHAMTAESRVDWAKARLGPDVELVILHETLEACSDAAAVLSALLATLAPTAWLAVTYSNGQSFPAMLLRRYWPNFFDFKTAFFNTSNLAALMTRFGFVLTSQGPVHEHHTVDYVLARLTRKAKRRGFVGAATTVPVRTGAHAATFRRRTEAQA